MNKKLLSGLCAAVLLSGLVGCGPKESKQNTTTSTSTIETKNNTTNNSEVTEKNFKDFPDTDEKYFTYEDGKKDTQSIVVLLTTRLFVYQKPLMVNLL